MFAWFSDSSRPIMPEQCLPAAVNASDPARASRLDMVLRLWSEPLRTWPRLYRIMEEIDLAFEDAAGQYACERLASECLIVSPEQYLRFAHSASEARKAGREARHAEGKAINKAAMKLSNPWMEDDEAVRFVQHAVIRALQKACKPALGDLFARQSLGDGCAREDLDG